MHPLYEDHGLGRTRQPGRRAHREGEIRAEYPSLQPEDIQAALAYAADLAGEEDFTPSPDVGA
jgi:hypothetical protein